MDLVLLLGVFILGLCVGSFLNVVILRLESGASFVRGRSQCPNCDHMLGWRDLLPVVSFLELGGKCRYCRRKISVQYPLVELITGLLFAVVLAPVWLGEIWSPRFWFVEAPLLLGIFSALVVIFVFDLRNYIIPDRVIYPALAAAFLLSFAQGVTVGLWLDRLLAALLAGAFFLFLVIATQGKGMGGGDIKLAALMGLVLGMAGVALALFVAFLLGAAVGLWLILQGKKSLQSRLPFGPFLVVGFAVSYWFSEPILNFYWGWGGWGI